MSAVAIRVLCSAWRGYGPDPISCPIWGIYMPTVQITSDVVFGESVILELKRVATTHETCEDLEEGQHWEFDIPREARVTAPVPPAAAVSVPSAEAASAPPMAAVPVVAPDPEECVSSSMPVAPIGDDLRPSNSKPVMSSAEEMMSSSSNNRPEGQMTQARTGARVQAPDRFVPGALAAEGLPRQPLSKIVAETYQEALARTEA
jgi:hypothetical protein